jgi:hypothetical protein
MNRSVEGQMPKRVYLVIDVLADAGFKVKQSCRVLEVSSDD